MKRSPWIRRALVIGVLFLGWAGAVLAVEVTAPIDPDNDVSGSGAGNYSGDITKMTDGSGMNGNPTDGPAGWPRGETHPSNWMHTVNSYPSEWQCTGSGNGLLIGATNGKIGWITFDIGTSLPVENLYFWNIRAGESTGIDGFNLYFADNAVGIPSPSKVDYQFSAANGWTQYNDDDADPTTPRYNLPTPVAPYYGSNINVSGTTARYIGVEVLTNHGSTVRIGLAEFAATYTDNTLPTLAPVDIVDAAGGSVEVYKPVTYTLTFVEQMGMDPSSVTTGDFSNASGGTMAVDGITQTGANVFEIIVTPTSTGPLQLRVSSNVTDWAGLTLAANVDDANIVTVATDSTAPQVLSITSYNDGAPVAVNNPITYTITFDQHMDAGSFAIGDFANAAGSAAPITVDSVTTGAVASVFTVVVTPTGVGDVLLRLTSGSVTDASGTATAQDWDDAAAIAIVDPGLVIDEPFADDDPTLSGNVSGMGLSGNWGGDSRPDITNGLKYGELITSSNAVYADGSWFANTVSIDTGEPAYTALLAPGGQMWFSMIYRMNTGAGRFYVTIGDTTLVNNGALSGGQAIGFGSTGSRVYAGLWESTSWPGNLGGPAPTSVDVTGDMIVNGDDGGVVASGNTYLIVGHVQWGAAPTDDDTVTLYFPDSSDLALGPVVAKSVGQVSQDSFDALNSNHGNGLTSIWDEIRVGATYNDVIPIPPPTAGTVLIIK